MSSLEPVDEPDFMLSYQLTGYAQPLHRAETLHPRPGCHEVLLRVDASGVCHSDLHLYDGHFDLGDGHRLDLTKGRELPLTLGHEIAGTVVATGTDATDVAVGDRRVVYPWIGCGDCETCTLGDEHVCATPRPLGVILGRWVCGSCIGTPFALPVRLWLCRCRTGLHVRVLWVDGLQCVGENEVA